MYRWYPCGRVGQSRLCDGPVQVPTAVADRDGVPGDLLVPSIPAAAAQSRSTAWLHRRHTYQRLGPAAL